jgi:hypothetical protein
MWEHADHRLIEAAKSITAFARPEKLPEGALKGQLVQPFVDWVHDLGWDVDISE